MAFNGRVIDISENGIYIRLGITEEGMLKLLHFSALPLKEEEIHSWAVHDGFPLVNVNIAGADRPYERQGNQYIVTAPGYRMKYIDHVITRNDEGMVLCVTSGDEETGIQADTLMQFYDGIPVVRMKNIVRNVGDAVQTVDYVSGFHYEGFEKEGAGEPENKLRVFVPHNGWQRELNWREYKLSDLALERNQSVETQRTSKIFKVTNTGNWSTKEYIPMGLIVNRETGSGLFWEIEHNGSWHWELGYQFGHMYVAAAGPSEIYSHWSKDLAPGESFESVPVAVGVSAAGTAENAVLNDSFASLTRYRRIIRRPNEDNRKLAVIFNDYMNCLFGDPTTAAELPLIDAAAAAGCEYFVVDAGWYSAGPWWDSVGEWEESRERFPNGLSEVMDYVRAKGMIPGVWIEPEVMGINCALAKKVPDDWFFMRHGKRVYDRSRFQLDYRNPEVVKHMDAVIDRLVNEYHVGYFKMDYNIEPGIGTTLNADSAGDGLLEHERAVIAWLDGIFERYPDLIIENCGSGGQRMDYAMLSRLSIQSTSDMENYLDYAMIATNAPTAVTPEQAAVWSYPLDGASREETVFNMVNTMLLRIHQSGHLARISDDRRALVAEGISVYKSIRGDILNSVPFWPIGLAKPADPWMALGLNCGERGYLAVWKLPARYGAARTEADGAVSLPVPEWVKSAECIYPAENDIPFTLDAGAHTLGLSTDKPACARLFRLS